jgi:serine/threonine-protein kinase HipA
MRRPEQQRVAGVRIGNGLVPVGKLRFTEAGRRQHSEFTYLEEWIGSPRGFALAPDLRLSPAPFYASMAETDDQRDSLPGAFQDASPDDWGRRLMERVHGAGLSEFDMLTLSDDGTRQGALRFVDDEGAIITSDAAPVPRLVDLETLRAVAARVEAREEVAPEELRRLAGAGGSIGGARPKASVTDEDDLWIAKFSSVGDRSPVERIEVATLQLARACGLRAPESRLMLARTDDPVALIRRFDRRDGNRVPFISARTALEKRGAEQGSYTEIADVIRQICRYPIRDLHELWSRIVFTVLVTNTDDHLKNHGFIYAGDDFWRLSPLFDVNPQPGRHSHLKTAIMEGAPFDASLELALEAAEFFDLGEEEAEARTREIADTLAAEWRAAMRASGVSGEDLRALEPAFEHDDAEAARAL